MADTSQSSDFDPRASRVDTEPLWREALGEHLRKTRHDRDETLNETAERAGISPQYLSEIERGIKEPSSEMIAAVAGALDVSLAELASGVAERVKGDASVAVSNYAAYALAA